jgi:hypothetical protein
LTQTGGEIPAVHAATIEPLGAGRVFGALPIIVGLRSSSFSFSKSKDENEDEEDLNG